MPWPKYAVIYQCYKGYIVIYDLLGLYARVEDHTLYMQIIVK